MTVRTLLLALLALALAGCVVEPMPGSYYHRHWEYMR